MRTKWAKQTLGEAQEYVATLRYSVRHSKTPQHYFGYTMLMSELIDAEPASFQEASKCQVWMDAMMEEYSSIMKNNIWEVVP